jgi:hypothetical protein
MAPPYGPVAPAAQPVQRLPPGEYLAPAELPYDRNQPVPAGYRIVSTPDVVGVAAGYGMLALGYGAATAMALSTNFDNSTVYLLVPVFGPWLTIGRRHHADCSGPCAKDRFFDVAIVLDGLIQFGGGAALLKGYLMERHFKLVRRDLALSVAPQPMGSGYGVAAHATF